MPLSRVTIVPKGDVPQRTAVPVCKPQGQCLIAIFRRAITGVVDIIGEIKFVGSRIKRIG